MAYFQYKDDANLSEDFDQNNSDRDGLPNNQSNNNPPKTRIASMSFGVQPGPASSTFMTVRLSKLGCMLCILATVIAVLLLVILIGVQLHYTKGLDRKTDALSLTRYTPGAAMTGDGGVNPTPAKQTGNKEEHPTPAKQTGNNEPHTTPAKQTGNGGQRVSTPITPAQTTHRGILPTVDISTTECVVGAGSMNVGAGDVFNDNSTYIANGRITGFDVRVKRREVTGIRLRYGTHVTDWRGWFPGGDITTVGLAQGELITSLTMHVGYHDGHLGVTGLEVVTSQGRSLGPYGSTSRSKTVGFWDELLYISGRAGGLIDRLDVHARGCNDG